MKFIHEAPRLNAEWRAVRDVAPEDVARGDVRNTKQSSNEARLRTLARSGRAHEHQTHQRRNPS